MKKEDPQFVCTDLNTMFREATLTMTSSGRIDCSANGQLLFPFSGQEPSHLHERRPIEGAGLCVISSVSIASYVDRMRLAARFQPNFALTNARPLAPIDRSVSGSRAVAWRKPSVIPSTVGSTHQPQPLSGRIDQGAPVVVRTGKPWASASATTIPKLSEWLGSTNRSASKKADFFLPYSRAPLKETTCAKPAADTAFSTCFWWPASSGPAICKIQPSGRTRAQASINMGKPLIGQIRPKK